MRIPTLRLLAFLAASCTILSGCAPAPIKDPIAVLQSPAERPARLERAMALTDETPGDAARLAALHRMIWVDGFTPDIREMALARLERDDLDNLKVTIRQRMPQLDAWLWLVRLSEIIADRGWTDLAPALISSWARPTIYERDDAKRPEYLALVRLFGRERVPDVIMETLIESNEVAQQGLRTRCWTLLNRLGYQERLAALLVDADIPENDLMLRDLRDAARDLGVVPRNREEILWVRKLREPGHQAFWEQAKKAVANLPPARRLELELRDLAIVVSASVHEPELLALSKDELYRRVETHLNSTTKHIASRSFDGWSGEFNQRLFEHRDDLTWGDLAAMLIAVRAMQVPAVRDHLFDYAQRDHDDNTSEYGGIIALDAQNRFEILEFPPQFRNGDIRFHASQAMFDAGYTAIFHFHFHVQEYENSQYAGPGMGDLQYADTTRANCLVFTYVSRSKLNVDYYRHSRLIVDLGEIEK